MYLHLGQDTVVRAGDIVGVFDIERCSTGQITRGFLKAAEERLSVTSVGVELPKSFVVCREAAGIRVYVSQISTAALRKRLERWEHPGA